MNFTFVVLTASAPRFKQLEMSVHSLWCRSSIRIVKHEVAPGNYRKSLIQAYQRASILASSTSGYVGFLEDDTYLSPHFCSTARRLFKSVEPNWEIVHLCPGFVWGRHSPSNKADDSFSYRPQRIVRGLETPKNKHLFNGPPNAKAWFGAPGAFVVNGRAIWSIIIRESNKNRRDPADVVLTKLAQTRERGHFIARDPPLCKERDQGLSLRNMNHAGI